MAHPYEDFYQHYCPDNLESLPINIASNEGREEEWWGELQATYGPWPPEGGEPAEPDAPPPAGSQPAGSRKGSMARSQQGSQKQPTPQGSRKPSDAGQSQSQLAPALSRQGTAARSQAMTRQPTARSASAISPGEQWSDNLYDAMKGWGTDEEAVFSALRAVPNQTAWDNVQRQFRRRHADMEDGDLLKALRGDLSNSEEGKITEIMLENGIDVWQPAGPTPAPSAPVSRRESQQQLQAQASQPALSRQGTRQSLQQAQSRLEEAVASGDLARQPTSQSMRQSQRQPTAVSLRQPSRQQSMAAAPAPEPVSPVSPGVDKREVQRLEQEMEQQKEELARAQSELRRAQSEMKRQNSQMQRNLDRSASSGAANQQQLQGLQSQVQAKTQEAESAQADAQQARQELAQLQRHVQGLEHELSQRPDQAQVQRTEQILNQAHDKLFQAQQQAVQQQAENTSLREQLSRAQEAIVHAANAGFEHDVKLHQARATLCSLMKKERKREKLRAASPTYAGSPMRGAGGSPVPGGASPMVSGGYDSGPRYYDALYTSPQSAGGGLPATHVSPRMSPPRPHMQPQNLY